MFLTIIMAVSLIAIIMAILLVTIIAVPPIPACTGLMIIHVKAAIQSEVVFEFWIGGVIPIFSISIVGVGAASACVYFPSTVSFC
jgi:hypothetical protein